MPELGRRQLTKLLAAMPLLVAPGTTPERPATSTEDYIIFGPAPTIRVRGTSRDATHVECGLESVTRWAVASHIARLNGQSDLVREADATMISREDELADDLIENDVRPQDTKRWLRSFRGRLEVRIWPILTHPDFVVPEAYRRLRYYTDFGGADWFGPFETELEIQLASLAAAIKGCWTEARITA